jgi:hypothetical protein
MSSFGFIYQDIGQAADRTTVVARSFAHVLARQRPQTPKSRSTCARQSAVGCRRCTGRRRRGQTRSPRQERRPTARGSRHDHAGTRSETAQRQPPRRPTATGVSPACRHEVSSAQHTRASSRSRVATHARRSTWTRQPRPSPRTRLPAPPAGSGASVQCPHPQLARIRRCSHTSITTRIAWRRIGRRSAMVAARGSPRRTESWTRPPVSHQVSDIRVRDHRPMLAGMPGLTAASSGSSRSAKPAGYNTDGGIPT